MKSDEDIRRDVEAELQWDPDIRAADIGVAVRDGVVTLTGFVRSFAQKSHAEGDAKRVGGVRAVANDIEVRLPNPDERPDPEIARDAVQEIQSRLPYSGVKITVTVKNGWVTLEGEVEWHYLRERAEEAVRRVRGAKGITDLIAITPKVATTVVKSHIEDALKRSAETDAKNITVEVDGDEVTLRGQVRSWAERQDAERAAWRAPDVRDVQNLITINA